MRQFWKHQAPPPPVVLTVALIGNFRLAFCKVNQCTCCKWGPVAKLLNNMMLPGYFPGISFYAFLQMWQWSLWPNTYILVSTYTPNKDLCFGAVICSSTSSLLVCFCAGLVSMEILTFSYQLVFCYLLRVFCFRFVINILHQGMFTYNTLTWIRRLNVSLVHTCYFLQQINLVCSANWKLYLRTGHTFAILSDFFDCVLAQKHTNTCASN